VKSRGAGLDNDPAEATARAWVARVNQLKMRLEQNPKARTPELQFVTDEDWLRSLDTNSKRRTIIAAHSLICGASAQ